MHRLWPVAVLILMACKGPEEYLSDIRTSVDSDKGQLNLSVYDGGLLVHEAFSGLMDEEVLTLSQAGRAAHQGAWLAEANEVALIRADALNLLVHLAMRYPFPPADTPYSEEKKVGEVAFAEIEKLHAATKELEVEPLIGTLGSPDRAVVERSWSKLRELTGQGFGPEASAWETWWEGRRPAVLAEAAAAATGPVTVLGNLRYASLSSARAVLGYLATSLLGYDVPDLRPALSFAITRIGRQATVYAVQKSLTDPDPVVRSAAYRATMELLDPAFLPALHSRARPGSETDPDARVLLLQALSFYPGRLGLEALLVDLGSEQLAVAWSARRSLVDLCGRDLGDDEKAWVRWYEKEGKLRWP